MSYYLTVLKKYAVFSGRARRTEYWMFVLVNLIIGFVLGFVQGMLGNRVPFIYVYDLLILIPAIAAGVRRMHDTNHSGWWLLVPIVNLVFAVTGGEKGDNRFGHDPKPAAA